MAEKDTIYIDIDDEITAVIDKVENSTHKIVALVLPKRATAMQSLVNMKLLKRAADDAKKNLVLITSESGLMPLAGAAGLHVAPTPTSKPTVPKLPDQDDSVEDIDEPAEALEPDFDARTNENKPIGEVAGIGAAAIASEAGGKKIISSEAGEDDIIDLDNSEPLAATVSPKSKKGKNKKLKVPNFKKFRLGIVIALLALVGLGVLFYFALEVWPHATVKIYTDQKPVDTSFTANLNPSASAVDPSTDTVPATAQTEQKSYSQTVPASGQKDEGQPASGTVNMTEPCSPNPPADVPAGTGVSTNNLTYITQQTVQFTPGFNNNNQCIYSGSTNITAQKAGDNYNVSSATFQVSGRSDVSASGQASGGSSNVVRVVQQSDIDAAKQKLKGQQDSSINQALQTQLKQNNLMALPQTFATLPSNVDASAKAGDQADNVTVTENVNYVMFGVKKSDLSQLIKANVNQQISTKGQGILDDGLSQASFTLNGTPSASAASVKVSTTAIVGPKLDVGDLKKQVEGKKAGDIRSQLGGRSGVSKVQVDLSPFWVGSVPKNPAKISIEFQKTNG